MSSQQPVLSNPFGLLPSLPLRSQHLHTLGIGSLGVSIRVLALLAMFVFFVFVFAMFMPLDGGICQQ